MPRALVILIALALGACDGRDLYDPVDNPFQDGGRDGSSTLPPSDGDADADADESADGAADADGDGSVPLECGYPSSGYGYWTGRVLEPFALWTCDGEETSLPELWCGHDATIVHVVVAWCGVCEGATHDVLRALAELDGRDVAFVEIIVEDALPGDVADEETCLWWENRFDGYITAHIPVDGETTSPLWDLASAEPLPHLAVLDRSGTIRIWEPVTVPSDLASQIRSILSEG